jgi:hypothetical protein
MVAGDSICMTAIRKQRLSTDRVTHEPRTGIRRRGWGGSSAAIVAVPDPRKGRTMTDLSKSQLNTILSALDGVPRNPNSRTPPCAASLGMPGAWVWRLTTSSSRPRVCSTVG